MPTPAATPADWYPPGASAKVSAQFLLTDNGDAKIICADGRRHIAEWREVTVSARLARLPRRLEFPGGGWASVADNDFIDRLPSPGPPGLAMRLSRALHFVERRLWTAVVLLAVALTVGVAVVRVGIPALAQVAAANLPGDAVAQLGDDFYERLRDREWLQTSRLSAADWNRAHDVFDEVAADLNGDFRDIAGIGDGENEFHYRLRIHAFSFGDGDGDGDSDGAVVGDGDGDGDGGGDGGGDGDGDGNNAQVANAFALPSGLVVFTDALVTRLDDAQLAAVAAHEIGHVRGRHALRILIQSASVLTLFGILSGDVSGLAIAPVALAQLQYSRDFEVEADCFAYRYMAAKGIAWEALGDALARIEADDGEVDAAAPVTRDDANGEHRGDDGVAAALLTLLSTHPPSEARADPVTHCTN